MLSDINIEVQRGRIWQYQNNSIFGNKYLFHITNKIKLGTDHILMSGHLMSMHPNIYIPEDCSKISKIHPERRALAEHFSLRNSLSLLIKVERLIQISVLIFIQVRSIQRWEICNKSGWSLKLFKWLSYIYIYVCVCVCVCVCLLNLSAKCRVRHKVSFPQGSLNSEFSFFKTGCLTKAKRPSLPNNLSMVLGRANRSIFVFS